MIRFELRRLAIPADIATIHDWVSRDYARYWGMQGLDRAAVQRAYVEIVAPAHVEALIGVHEGAPAFLAECYHPAHELELAARYEARASDRGLHILVGPRPARPIPGFTRAAFAAVVDHLFAAPEVERLVVEPDVRNHKIRALNRAFGFRELRPIELPATATTPVKTAMLSICTRDDLARARASTDPRAPRTA